MARGQITRTARSRVTALARRWVPDAGDPRYPRSWWLGSVRTAIGFWWVALVLYLANVLASGALLALRHGLSAVASRAAVVHLLLLDRVGSALSGNRWLLIPVGGAVAALLVAWRWALEDRARESRVLLVRGWREARSGQVLGALGRIAARWLRHQVTLFALVAMAAIGGVAVALLNIPAR